MRPPVSPKVDFPNPILLPGQFIAGVSVHGRNEVRESV
jgi:hypothetical protein